MPPPPPPPPYCPAAHAPAVHKDLDLLLRLSPDEVPQTEAGLTYRYYFRGEPAERVQRRLREAYVGAAGLTAREIDLKIKKEAAIVLMMEQGPPTRFWGWPAEADISVAEEGAEDDDDPFLPALCGVPKAASALDVAGFVHNGGRGFFGELVYR